MGVPLNSIPGPSGLVCILRGTPAKIIKKNDVGVPLNSIPDPSACNLESRRKRGLDESAPPLLNRTRPHALNIGRVLWGSPPKHLVPMLMRTRASSPQHWP
ncbi:hypothetical protein AB205_0145920, partial [Aquarana catesbeiana]